MKSLYTAITFIMLLAFGIFQAPIFAQSQQNSSALSYQECQNRIGDEMQKIVDSINKTKAILLAIDSNEFQSKTNGFRYVYSDIFTNMTEDQNVCGNVKLTSIVVEFSILNSSSNFVKFIQVGEDPQISQVILVEDAFVSNCDNSCPPPSPPAGNIQKPLTSPLRQIASGVSPKDVKCRQDLTLIFRAEDNFPACVKPDTASKLVERGWAMSSLKNFGYNPGRGPASPEPKESGQFSSIGPSPFPPSTLNRLVFFIKSNSTAQIHVRYTSEFENTGNVDTGGQFYSGNPHDFIPLDSSQITISSSPDHVSMNYGTNTTVVYEISTKNVTSGLYWIVLTQICGAIPVAIDTTSSQITPSDIPVYSQHCPAQVLNAKILGISGGNAEYLQSQELQ